MASPSLLLSNRGNTSYREYRDNLRVHNCNTLALQGCDNSNTKHTAIAILPSTTHPSSWVEHPEKYMSILDFALLIHKINSNTIADKAAESSKSFGDRANHVSYPGA